MSTAGILSKEGLLQYVNSLVFPDYAAGLVPVDIRVAGSMCYGYFKDSSDLDVVVYFDTNRFGKRVCFLSAEQVEERQISVIGKPLIMDVAPNYGSFTLPEFSLITNKLHYYNPMELDLFLQRRRLLDPEFGKDRIHLDPFNLKIQLAIP